MEVETAFEHLPPTAGALGNGVCRTGASHGVAGWDKLRTGCKLAVRQVPGYHARPSEAARGDRRPARKGLVVRSRYHPATSPYRRTHSASDPLPARFCGPRKAAEPIRLSIRKLIRRCRHVRVSDSTHDPWRRSSSTSHAIAGGSVGGRYLLRRAATNRSKTGIRTVR